MMATSAERRVDRYLRELDRELHALPAARRRDIVEDIAAHIEEAQAEEGPQATPSILERLGDPSEIAADARERFDVRSPRPGWVETGALILLPFGAFIVPVIGWFAGVVLLWSSAVWSTRDKLIGTFVLPGGLSGMLFVLLFLAGGSFCEGSETSVGGRVVSTTSTCGSGPSTLEMIAWAVLAIALLVLPLVSVFHLASKRRIAAKAAAA